MNPTTLPGPLGVLAHAVFGALDLVSLILLAARLGPLAAFAPLLPPRGAVPRILLVVLLVTVLAPHASVAPGAGATLSLTSLAFVAAFVRELVVGAGIALAISVPFIAFEQAGRLVDVARGGGQAEITLPSGERVSIVAGGHHMLALAVFAAIGGLPLTIGAIATHLRAHPLGAPALVDGAWLEAALRLSADTLTLSVVLALPSLASLLLADVVLGLLARAAQGLPIYFVAMPLRAVLGLGVSLLALAFAIPTLVDAVARALVLTAA